MRQRKRGFTLLELLVVLAIFGVFSAMAYGGLNYILKTRRQLETSLDRMAELQRGFQKLRNELQQASARTSRDSNGQAAAAVLFEDFSQTLTFTRAGWRNPLSAARPGLERVVLRFDRDKKQLIRDSYNSADIARDDLRNSLVLIEQITELKWRFYVGNAWQDRWQPARLPATASQPASPSPAVPTALELTLTTADYGPLRWVFLTGDTVPAPGIVGTTNSN